MKEQRDNSDTLKRNEIRVEAPDATFSGQLKNGRRGKILGLLLKLTCKAVGG